MTAKETVLACLQAINAEDFATARTYMHDSMNFEGVMGSRDGADAYLQDMERMKLKYEFKKSFEDGEDVCLLTDLTISGKTIFCCSWYHVKDCKIDSLKVVFDPRSLMEGADKK